jgi:hypothetical protein
VLMVHLESRCRRVEVDVSNVCYVDCGSCLFRLEFITTLIDDGDVVGVECDARVLA